MHLSTRNVNTAFETLVRGFHTGEIPTVRSTSRYGDVMTLEDPIIVTYEKPLERVLFNEARDCNPFFHVYEALWMLAGRNDVEPLAYFNSKMRDFSDDGTTFNGAYGYRWRHAKADGYGSEDDTCTEHGNCTDQLKIIIDEFKARPDSRRVVLQMWNVGDDLLKIAPGASKDVCCNTNAYFRLRPTGISSAQGVGVADKQLYELDMTVCNRSNDLVWGMLGANVVHFAFLQEYLAACIGVQVGKYHQLTNNLHVYVNNWKPEEWLQRERGFYLPHWNSVPLVRDPAVFDREIQAFVNHAAAPYQSLVRWKEPFLNEVAAPMCNAFTAHKQRDDAAADFHLHKIRADDWRVASIEWINRRRRARKAKQAT
jgi:thymidylate synthase